MALVQYLRRWVLVGKPGWSRGVFAAVVAIGAAFLLRLSLGAFLQGEAPFATFFPAMVTALPTGYVFLFFCLMMVLQLIWVVTAVPETKGVPLEEIEKRLGVRSRRPDVNRRSPALTLLTGRLRPVSEKSAPTGRAPTRTRARPTRRRSCTTSS